ncbi:hypothetical protein HYH02_002424 [Chlamydomonas schloesseri]|uniref:Zinc-finger domain-containing protein n=1 Tax=Chlamydomonas schloesseri TaxID=2026947 RepID=A0A835WTC9_9CHLO|nr:hypothetical protein HYH02_002424 [Chlamydomonas schloesseri]|eukprot:KAG2453092.1 hypothetical protein HYH02_002424 [Chlamydomonas schloesseri]
MPNTEEMDLDKERQERIAKNQAMLASLGVTDAVASARAAAAKANPASPPKQPRKPRAPASAAVLPQRRSGRIAGVAAPEMVELDDNGMPVRGAAAAADEEGSGEGAEAEGLMDLVGNNDLRLRAGRAANLSEQQLAEVNRLRTSSKSRGTVYAHLGVTCHFCRQKKLCGEEECPRCAFLDEEAECIGKSQCSRCHSFNGVFCRACLDCRYGLQLEEVRADPNWLCAHCYEQEHGPWEKHGWYCNTSFCMENRGMKPTGIAIHEAKQLGYRSVGHWLQAMTLAMTPAEVAAIKARGEAWAKGKRRKGGRAGGAKRTAAAKGRAGKAAAAAPEPAADTPSEAHEDDEGKEAEDADEAGQEEQGPTEAAEGKGQEEHGTKRKAMAMQPPEEAGSPEQDEGPSCSDGDGDDNGAGEEGGVAAGVELEAEVEGAAAGAGVGLGAPEQHAEEAAAGLDVPLLKRRRVGRKAAAEEVEAQEAVKAQEAAAAAVAAAATLGDTADEPLASRRRTGRITRARA